VRGPRDSDGGSGSGSGDGGVGGGDAGGGGRSVWTGSTGRRYSCAAAM